MESQELETSDREMKSLSLGTTGIPVEVSLGLADSLS